MYVISSLQAITSKWVLMALKAFKKFCGCIPMMYQFNNSLRFINYEHLYYSF